MALSNMQKFQEYTVTAAMSELDQQIQLFNAATRNALMLTSSTNMGDIADATFWKRIPGMMRRRDPNATGTVNQVPLAQGKHTSVKVGGGTEEITFDQTQFDWLNQNPEVAGVVFGEQLAQGMLQDMLNSAIRCANAAIGTQDTLIQDNSAAALNRAGFAQAAGRFGDRSQNITAWLTHSKPATDLQIENITNENRLFTIETIQVVQDGLGRIVVITDSDELVEADGVEAGVDEYTVLGLQAGAVQIGDNGTLHTNIEKKNGKNNIQTTMQAEFDFQVELLGYSWSLATGGAAPNNAAMASGSNWEMTAESTKETAGVILRVQ